ARHASVPTHLSSEQLARLLQRPAAPGPAAYRDRAILSLLARLGLRAGEVATLELDDLDWRVGQLRLRAGKCRRERVLPLPPEVGQEWFGAQLDLDPRKLVFIDESVLQGSGRSSR